MSQPQIKADIIEPAECFMRVVVILFLGISMVSYCLIKPLRTVNISHHMLQAIPYVRKSQSDLDCAGIDPYGVSERFGAPINRLKVQKPYKYYKYAVS